MKLRSWMSAIALTVTVGLMTAAAIGTREDQMTSLTVDQPIEVPGAVLAPGEYTMELLLPDARDNVVVIRDEDNEVVSTALTITNERNEITSDTKLMFYETGADSPPALRLWYYPAAREGREFVYPESRGGEIAEESGRNVPTVSDEEYERVQESDASTEEGEPAAVVVKEVTIYSTTPEGEEGDVEEGQQANLKQDAKMMAPDQFVQARELEESRLARQIRKEIVTLPFYSLWDHIEFRLNDDGEVELMGKVYRPSLKRSVERVVRNVEGVTSIENNLEILPTSDLDDDIRRAAYRTIYGHPTLQQYQLRAVPPIHIIVENGTLTLEGVVANQMDKNVAGVQAQTVNNVFEVRNNLRVES